MQAAVDDRPTGGCGWARPIFSTLGYLLVFLLVQGGSTSCQDTEVSLENFLIWSLPGSRAFAFFCEPRLKAYKVAFEKAAKRVKNSDGKSGRVKFKAETDYYPFRMKDSLPVVKRAVAAVSSIGGTPTIRSANGELDANWMVRYGVPTVTFGAGQNEPHTIDEWINLDEYDRACALAVQLATMR